jgi:hypothetical protein
MPTLTSEKKSAAAPTAGRARADLWRPLGIRSRARDGRPEAEGALRALHRRQVRRAEVRQVFRLHQPGQRAEARRDRAGRGRRCRRRLPGGAAGLRQPSGAGCPASERAKYLYRIARLLQDRAREFAVAETMDGGKPIKETRDFDVPMAAAHFFYHAGWADKLEYVAPGRRVAPLGVVGQVIPWNFPLLMLAWKIAPALAMGNCVVIKPAKPPASPRSSWRRFSRTRACRRRGQHHHRPRRHRRGHDAHPIRGQDRVHRLDRGRQDHHALARRHGQEDDDGARRQGGEHRVRRRADRPGRRGHRQRHLLQPGPRLLRRLAPARAGAGGRKVVAKLKHRIRSCASAIRSTRTPTSARSTPASSSPRSANSWTAA